MHVNLFFCGDSVTYGMELEPEHEEYRFSNLVSTDKNLSHHNRSLSGACNDWIVKNTIQYFREGNTCDTAIIQFSAPERWQFYDSEHTKWTHIGAKRTTDNLLSQAMRDAHSAYYEKIYTPELANENYWKNVFFIDEYLKDKCNTIYLTLEDPTEATYTERVQDATTGKVTRPIVRYDYYKDVDIGSVTQIVRRSTLVGHPSIEGHRKIADYILKKL